MHGEVALRKPRGVWVSARLRPRVRVTAGANFCECGHLDYRVEAGESGMTSTLHGVMQVDGRFTPSRSLILGLGLAVNCLV